MTTRTCPHFALSWEEDYARRINPRLMTDLLHQAVPVLRYADWKILHVEEGLCQSLLPLNVATTNQHGTHQAALISLSADYTGGMALATLLRGVPLSGIHRCHPDESASLWLASMSVRFRAPSSGHMTATCRVDEKTAAEIQQRYFNGDRVLATLPVEFRSNGDLVANAEMKYFAQPTAKLIPTVEHPSRSVLFSHRLKASARMIAGVRAQPLHRGGLRLENRHDAMAAGPHGEILADRLRSVLPELTDMVHARTLHCDSVLRSIPQLAQVVLVGAGLDLRPIRLHREFPMVHFIELDLPEMLQERDRILSQIPGSESVRRTTRAVDFKSDDLSAALRDHRLLDPALPTLFIYEGCSMYFTQEENERILGAIGKLLQHPSSRLWTDFVTTAVVEGLTENAGVSAFLRGMEELGERFVFGTDNPAAFLRSAGFGDVAITTSGQFLKDSESVFDTYMFTVAGPRSASPGPVRYSMI